MERTQYVVEMVSELCLQRACSGWEVKKPKGKYPVEEDLL